MFKTKVSAVFYEDPNKLEVADTNVRYLIPSEEALQTIINSVKEVGVLEPVVLNTEGKIVSGQLRWIAAKKAGLKEIPCVKIEFLDKFAEMIACIAQDTIRHPLTLEEKYKFAKKARELGYKVEEIAKALGVGESTVWSWLEAYERSPPQLQGTPSEKVLFKLPVKKKRVVDRALREPEYVKDLEKSVELLEFAKKAPLRDLEQIEKDVKQGLKVDLKKREEVHKVENVLWELRIPKKLDNMFKKILKKQGKDFLATVIELVEEYVKEHSDLLLEE